MLKYNRIYPGIWSKLLSKSSQKLVAHDCIIISESVKNATNCLLGTRNVPDSPGTIIDPLADITWKIGIKHRDEGDDISH